MIINNRSNWSESKLRIFCTASGVEELEKEQRGSVYITMNKRNERRRHWNNAIVVVVSFTNHRMTVLLSKVRIDYSDLFIITDANTPPRDKTKLWFDSLIRPFTQRAPVDSNFFIFFTHLNHAIKCTNVSLTKAITSLRRSSKLTSTKQTDT